MAISAVNLVPGSSSEAVSPTDPVAVGLRSTTSSVDTGSILVHMGFSGVIHGSAVPELDTALASKTESIALETVENRLTASVGISRAVVTGSLVLTKTSNSPSDQCVYAIRAKVAQAASALAYVKFRTNSAWQTQSPDWLNQTSVVCPYIGLEHGQHNTACYAFLRKTGLSTGEVVVGGPLSSLSTARPGETSLASTDWAALPDNSVVEMWIYFNQGGYLPPYPNPYVPVVEVWVKFPSDAGPVVKHSTIVGDLGTFSSDTNYANSRPGPDDFVTLYIGNAGKTGDVLQIDDWALFPDFRKAVEEGIPTTDHAFRMVPDLNNPYLASSGKLPSETVPCRWVPVTEWGTVEEAMAAPGWSGVPTQAVLTKSIDGQSGLEREEPRIGQRVDGFVVEAFMSADETRQPTDQVFGAGFGVDDGAKLYQVVAATGPIRTLGVTKTLTSPGTASSTHLSSTEVDWRSRKLVRMSVDRYRTKVTVEVDDEEVLEAPWGDFPSSIRGSGRVYFGHLLNVEERGELRLAQLRYFQRYKAWEAADGTLPPVSPLTFSLTESGGGGVDAPINVAAKEMLIRKTDVGIVGSKRFYTRSESVSAQDGLYVDVSTRVVSFNGADGSLMTPYTWSGAGLKVNLGSQSITLGFFECGAYGRKIGVIPGSGTVDDILRQTALGRKFSSTSNWLAKQRYRIFFNPGRSIDVFTGSTVNPPAFSIPWQGATSGFDIPADAASPSISFGHFSESTASVTAWGHVRFGQGNGQDLEITQKFPDGLESHHFGGKALVLVSASEL